MSVFNRDTVIKEDCNINDPLTHMMNMIVKINAIKESYGQEEMRSYAMTGQDNVEAGNQADTAIEKELHMQADFISNIGSWMKAYADQHKSVIMTYSDDMITVEDANKLDDYIGKSKYTKIVNYQFFDALIKLYYSLDYCAATTKSEIDGITYKAIESYASRIHFPESVFARKTVYETIDAVFDSHIIYTNTTSEQLKETGEYLLYSIPDKEKDCWDDAANYSNSDTSLNDDLTMYALSIMTYFYSRLSGLYKEMIEQFIDIANKVSKS